MDTIFIKDLVFAGRHGVNPDEHVVFQRFSVSVRMDLDTKEAADKDDLSLTVDYKNTRDLIRSIVEGEHNYLIERMGQRIAEGILKDSRVERCTVTIEKLDIWGNGTPGVSIDRLQPKAHISLDTDRLLRELSGNGFSVHSLLDAPQRRAMKEAAEQYPFLEAEKEYGKHKVRQRFTYYRAYPPENLLWKIGREIAEAVEKGLAGKKAFASPLGFTEISAQRYLPRKLGITLHHDSVRFRNIVTVCVIEGEAEFYTSTKRSGGKETSIPTRPGDVIFMRAPGFMDCPVGPFHAVRNITSPRLSVTYRQEEALDK